jgi:hypothetical protein
MRLNPTLVLVGGFLGAGKTTLILRATELLRARGLRVAVIMNDQDRGLVDTRFAEANRVVTQEVAGGCFCCRFSELLTAARSLSEYSPDVIFAEPVGSCVDLSATILQPLKAFHRGEYHLAPLTVLFDPGLAARVYAGQEDSNISYLFRYQLEEADLVCAAKHDLRRPLPDLPVPVDFHISARTGEGVEAWLHEVLEGNCVVGARLLEVDYGRYAEAEAALGWLNLHAEVYLGQPATPAGLAVPLLRDLDRALTAQGVSIAHLKIFDRTSTGFAKTTICANGAEIAPDGDLSSPQERRHDLVINLRALADPSLLQNTVRSAIASLAETVSVKHSGAFRPAPPKPEYRFDRLV